MQVLQQLLLLIQLRVFLNHLGALQLNSPHTPYILGPGGELVVEGVDGIEEEKEGEVVMVAVNGTEGQRRGSAAVT